MSRLRIGITPDAWKEEPPAAAHLRARSVYQNVPAETVGNMRPILTPRRSYIDASTDDGWKRREQNALKGGRR